MSVHRNQTGLNLLPFQVDREHSTIRLIDLAGGPAWSMALVGFTLEYERRRLQVSCIQEIETTKTRAIVRGTLPESTLAFEVTWQADPAGWMRKQVMVHGRADPDWGRFLRLMVMNEPLPAGKWDDQLGWREQLDGSSRAEQRAAEEGSGNLPVWGYPVFGKRWFIGLEHPMGIARCRESRLELLHHPQWQGEKLESFSAIIGCATFSETVPQAFHRYLSGIRRPPPERAVIEINTFWTDFMELDEFGSCRFHTSLEGYQRLIKEWAGRILNGEKGLVDLFTLDAGWQENDSLFAPARALKGPGDDGLIKLGALLQLYGISLGLWWSWNGAIGTNSKWAKQQGYRVSASGAGSGYTCAGGTLHYQCFTDPAWEVAIGRRIEELIDRTSVSFFKFDWDNEGIEDPDLYPNQLPLREQMWEANVTAMLRLYARATAGRPGVRVRGGYWASPWWTQYADTTTMPHSADNEAADLPSLTQRDAYNTSRDMATYHNMVTCRTPLPWDFLNYHEFASAPRNAVHDTDESWLNNLLLWISRGSYFLSSLFVSPYGLRGWRAWTLRETLRWFRANEDILWKSRMQMKGGNPGQGEVYGFLHETDGCRLLTLRNPLAYPQPAPTPQSLGLDAGDWTRLYPSWEPWAWNTPWMSSHAVWMLSQGTKDWRTQQTLLRGETGWQVPFCAATTMQRHGISEEIPAIHRLPDLKVRVEKPDNTSLAIHAALPYGLCQAEWVLLFRLEDQRHLQIRAAVGRYANDNASAPAPITWIQPHWRAGFVQRHIGTPPYDQSIAVARIPSGTGGLVHVFIHSEEPLPEMVGGWVEALEQSLPVEIAPVDPVRIPPSLPNRQIVLAAF